MDDAAIIAAASDVMAKLFYVYANNQCDYHGALDVYRPQANALAAMQVPDGSLSMTHEATQHPQRAPFNALQVLYQQIIASHTACCSSNRSKLPRIFAHRAASISARPIGSDTRV